MAAAIIPLVSAAIAAIGPQIPNIVQSVEALFGHSSTTGTQTGPLKMQASVDALTAMLQSFANAGLIPSAPVVDSSLPAGLVGAIQTVVDQLKAAGGLSATSVVPPTTQVVAKPAAAASVSGTKVTITGVMVTA